MGQKNVIIQNYKKTGDKNAPCAPPNSSVLFLDYEGGLVHY